MKIEVFTDSLTLKPEKGVPHHKLIAQSGLEFPIGGKTFGKITQGEAGGVVAKEIEEGTTLQIIELIDGVPKVRGYIKRERLKEVITWRDGADIIAEAIDLARRKRPLRQGYFGFFDQVLQSP